MWITIESISIMRVGCFGKVIIVLILNSYRFYFYLIYFTIKTSTSMYVVIWYFVHSVGINGKHINVSLSDVITLIKTRWIFFCRNENFLHYIFVFSIPTTMLDLTSNVKQYGMVKVIHAVRACSEYKKKLS